MSKFRSIETPYYGWEGLDNGGELFNTGEHEDELEEMLDDLDDIDHNYRKTKVTAEQAHAMSSISKRFEEAKRKRKELFELLGIDEVEFSELLGQSVMKKRWEYEEKIFLVLLFTIFFITGCSDKKVGEVDYSKRLSDIEVERFIISNLEKKYSTKFTLQLKSKNQISQCGFNLDGSCAYDEYIKDAYILF